MGDPFADLLMPAAAARCPACAAALRPGAPWCSLCYADLRPPEPSPEPSPDPAAASEPSRAYDPGVLDPLTAPAEALGLPAADPAAPERRWPCATCEATNPYTVSVCTACGTAFLAAVREAEGALLELPVLGDLTKLSRAQRLGLSVLVVLAIAALTALVGLLFG